MRIRAPRRLLLAPDAIAPARRQCNRRQTRRSRRPGWSTAGAERGCRGMNCCARARARAAGAAQAAQARSRQRTESSKSMNGEHRQRPAIRARCTEKDDAPRVLAGRQLRSAMELELFLVPLAVQLTAANQGVC